MSAHRGGGQALGAPAKAARALGPMMVVGLCLGSIAPGRGAPPPRATDGGLSAPVAHLAETREILLGDLPDICALGETTIYFGAGGVQPQGDEAMRVGMIADCLAGLTVERAIEVIGYSDPVGLSSDNRMLAAERAERVAEMLVEGGVDRGRLVVRALGEARSGPVTLRVASRRRVEIRFVPLDQGAGYALGYLPRHPGGL